MKQGEIIEISGPNAVNGTYKVSSVTEHQLTNLHLQETKDEETRLQNMREKVIVDLCGKYGRVAEEQE